MTNAVVPVLQSRKASGGLFSRSGAFPQLKYVALAGAVQADIQAGLFPVGEKLPSERVLADTYRVAYLTVRQSMGLLAKRGLIVRQHGRGTFVKSTSHKTGIGILCGPSLADETQHFLRALLKAIQAELKGQGIRCHAYDDLAEVHSSLAGQEPESYQRLQSDLHHYLFSGLIELDQAASWRCPSEADELPIVRLNDRCGQCDVMIDFRNFTSASLGYLQRAGKKKVVYLRTIAKPPKITSDLDEIARMTRDPGIARPQIHQFDHVYESHSMEREAYEKTVALVAEWRRTGQWPDALLISDDVGARGVALALSQSQVRAPADITFMTLASEGIEHHYGMPVVKWEIPVRETAQHLVRVLRQRMQDPRAQVESVLVAGRIKCEGAFE